MGRLRSMGRPADSPSQVNTDMGSRFGKAQGERAKESGGELSPFDCELLAGYMRVSASLWASVGDNEGDHR